MTASAPHREPFDLLAEEFLDRFRRGERPAVHEYAERHPELAEEIRELFPTLVAMEQAGAATSGTSPAAGIGFRCPERLGEYHILREVGRGGMGVVYEAVQESLGRRVALKVLPSHALMDPKHLQRFQREARAAAQLHHSHIVPVFGVGEAQGVHFFAMQFIDGQSLDLVLRGIVALRTGHVRPAMPAATATTERPDSVSALTDTAAHVQAYIDTDHSLTNSLTGQDPAEYYRRVARLGLQAAEALEYAHAQGIVHRDIKPSNLMLDFAGDVWITDFGLAKNEGPSELTQTGDVVGTLRYMAPEQLQGWADPRTDVHGLGLTLYELLALRPAYDAASRGDLMKQISERIPPPIWRRDREVPRDLETIVAKAIAREPGERYASARDLAEDLRRFLADKPIVARRTAWHEHLRRWARRNPVMAWLMTAVAALLITVAVVASAMNWRLQTSLAATAAAERDKTDQLWKSRLNEVLALRRTGRPGQRWQSWEKLTQAVALAKQVEAGEEARRDLRNAAISSLALTDLRYDKPGPLASPDGITGIILGFDPTLTKYLRSDAKANVSLRRVADDQEIASLAVGALGIKEARQVGGARFSADGRLLKLSYFVRSSGYQPAHVVIWDLRRQEIVFESPKQSWMYACDLSRDGRQVVVAGSDGVAHVYEVATKQETAVFRLPFMTAAMSLSPQGNRAAITSSSEVAVVDVPTGLVLHRFPHDGPYHLAWHPDGMLLAVTSNDFLVHVWNLNRGREQCVLRGHQAHAHDPAFTPDGEVLVTSTYDGTVRLWNAWTGKELVRGPGTMMSYMSADGGRLAVCHGSQYVFYDILRSEEYRTVPLSAVTLNDRFHCWPGPQHPQLHWRPVHGRDGLRILESNTGRELAKAPIGFTESPIWSPDGKALYTVGDGGFRRWPVVEHDDRLVIGPPEKLGNSGTSVSVHPDGSKLAVGSMSGVPYRLDLKRQPLVPERINHASPTTTAFSPDGKWFAAGTHHGFGLRVWPVGDEKHVAFLVPEVRRTYPMFSPDSRILAASVDEMLRLWRVDDWQPIRTLYVAGGHHPAFAFSPDGRVLAYTRSPYEVCLEELETGKQLAILEAPDDLQVADLRFDLDGSRLVLATGYPPTLRVWDLQRVRERLASIGLAEGLPEWQPSAASVANAKPVEFDEGLSANQLQARVETYRLQHEYELACADLEALLRLQPDQAGSINKLAWLRCIGPNSVRDMAKAETLVERAGTLDAQSPWIWNTKGAVLYRQKRFAEALDAFETAECVGQRFTTFPYPWHGFLQAMAHHRLGHKAEARQAYDASVKWLAANRAKTNTAWVYELDALQAEASLLLGVK